MRLPRLLKPHVCKHSGFWWLVSPQGKIKALVGERAIGPYRDSGFDSYMVIRNLIVNGKLIGYRDGE